MTPLGDARSTAVSPVPPVAGVLLDAVLLLSFAAIGRRSHAEASPVVGAFTTAWPFLVGAGVGWVVCRVALRRIPLDVRAGIFVWASTVVVGMALRAATGQGTALSFVAVAAFVTAVFLLGWRALAGMWSRRATR